MIAQLDREYLRARPTKALSRLISYALFEGRPLTTRGRWINPLVFAQLALTERLPQLRPVHAPIFLIGPGRSGTTVLGKTLSLHPEVGFLNEPKAIWHAGVGDEDLIGSYSRGPARVRLSAADATPDRRKRMHRMLGAYLLATGSRRLLDKYPELVFRVPFVRALFPDARFLFLVRDGRRTCASMASWSRRHARELGGECHDWWGADGRKWRLLVEQIACKDAHLAGHAEQLAAVRDPLLRARLEWSLLVRAGCAAQREYPEQVLRVSYEALLADPTDQLREIQRFCGLDPHPAVEGYAGRVLRDGGPGENPSPPRPSGAGAAEAAGELRAAVQELFEAEQRELGYGSP